MYVLSRFQSVAASRGLPSGAWTLSFSCLVLYMLCYYFSPEDYIPALEAYPFYKLLAGAALALQILRNLQNGRPWLTLPAEMRLLVPLLLLMLVNIAFSNWPGGSAEIFHGRIVKTVLLALLIANAIETEKQYRNMLVLMVASGALLASYVINSYLAGNVDRYGRPLGYGYKEFGNPNDLALGLLIVIPFAFQLLRWERGFLKRAGYFMALAGLVAAILVSMSRMGMAGLLFLAVVWLYSMGRSSILRPIAGMSLIFIALILADIAIPSLGDRFASIFDGTRDPNESRSFRLQHMWDGIEIIADHPLLGVGMGQSAEVIGRKHVFTEGHWERIHSLYIEFGAELGLPAIVILVFLLITVIRRLAQTAKSIKTSTECSHLAPYLDSARISLYTFAIAVNFAPASYSWVPYILIGLSSAILAIAQRLRLK